MTPELVSALTGFAWPLLIGFVLWVFRKEIRSLLQRLSKATVKGLELHFSRIGEKIFSIKAAGWIIPPAVHEGLRQLIPDVELTAEKIEEIRNLPEDRQSAIVGLLLEEALDWGLAQIGASEKDTHIGVRFTLLP